MKKSYFIIKVLILFFLICTNLYGAKSNFYNKGKTLYENKKFDESKIFFEKDIVFNPKNERSYLYLAKIYNNLENMEEEENNLNSVLLLNPKNDEAIYMLALIKIEQSDYNEAKRLIDKFNLVCNSFCIKKSEIQNKFNKLIPSNEKNKN